MGNCLKRGEPFNPGAVPDRVVANAEPACTLYNMANFKKGGQLIETFNKGGSKGVSNDKNYVTILDCQENPFNLGGEFHKRKTGIYDVQSWKRRSHHQNGIP